jgi:hypothetical protein
MGVGGSQQEDRQTYFLSLAEQIKIKTLSHSSWKSQLWQKDGGGGGGVRNHPLRFSYFAERKSLLSRKGIYMKGGKSFYKLKALVVARFGQDNEGNLGGGHRGGGQAREKGECTACYKL